MASTVPVMYSFPQNIGDFELNLLRQLDDEHDTPRTREEIYPDLEASQIGLVAKKVDLLKKEIDLVSVRIAKAAEIVNKVIKSVINESLEQDERIGGKEVIFCIESDLPQIMKNGDLDRVSPMILCWAHLGVTNVKNFKQCKDYINNHKWDSCLVWSAMYIFDAALECASFYEIPKDFWPALLREICIQFDQKYCIARQSQAIPLFPMQRIFKHTKGKNDPSQSAVGKMYGPPSVYWSKLCDLFNFCISDISQEKKLEFLEEFRSRVPADKKNKQKLNNIEHAYEFGFEFPKFMLFKIHQQVDLLDLVRDTLRKQRMQYEAEDQLPPMVSHQMMPNSMAATQDGLQSQLASMQSMASMPSVSMHAMNSNNFNTPSFAAMNPNMVASANNSGIMASVGSKWPSYLMDDDDVDMDVSANGKNNFTESAMNYNINAIVDGSQPKHENCENDVIGAPNGVSGVNGMDAVDAMSLCQDTNKDSKLFTTSNFANMANLANLANLANMPQLGYMGQLGQMGQMRQMGQIGQLGQLGQMPLAGNDTDMLGLPAIPQMTTMALNNFGCNQMLVSNNTDDIDLPPSVMNSNEDSPNEKFEPDAI